MFGAFIILLFKLYDPVRKFAYFYNSFQQAMGASSSISAFLTPRICKRAASRCCVESFAKSVQFENVGFSYSTARRTPDSAPRRSELRTGEVLALVGPSGAGKTTLANLIPRFFDVTSGRILIDGHDLRDLTLGSLRRNVAQVTQETISSTTRCATTSPTASQKST